MRGGLGNNKHHAPFSNKEVSNAAGGTPTGGGGGGGSSNGGGSSSQPFFTPSQHQQQQQQQQVAAPAVPAQALYEMYIGSERICEWVNKTAVMTPSIVSPPPSNVSLTSTPLHFATGSSASSSIAAGGSSSALHSRTNSAALALNTSANSTPLLAHNHSSHAESEGGNHAAAGGSSFLTAEELYHQQQHQQLQQQQQVQGGDGGIFSIDHFGNTTALVESITPYLHNIYPSVTFTTMSAAEGPPLLKSPKGSTPAATTTATTTTAAGTAPAAATAQSSSSISSATTMTWTEPKVPLADIWQSLHFPYGTSVPLEAPQVSLSPFLNPEIEIHYEPYLSAIHLQPVVASSNPQHQQQHNASAAMKGPQSQQQQPQRNASGVVVFSSTPTSVSAPPAAVVAVAAANNSSGTGEEAARSSLGSADRSSSPSAEDDRCEDVASLVGSNGDVQQQQRTSPSATTAPVASPANLSGGTNNTNSERKRSGSSNTTHHSIPINGPATTLPTAEPFVWYAPERVENRRGLLEQVELLAETECSLLMEGSTTDVSFDSWFSVLWQPIYCHHHTPQRSCGAFLAFYVFRPARCLFQPDSTASVPVSAPPTTTQLTTSSVPPSPSKGKAPTTPPTQSRIAAASSTAAAAAPRCSLAGRDQIENGAWDCPIVRTDKAALGFDYWAVGVLSDATRSVYNGQPPIEPHQFVEVGDVSVSPNTATPPTPFFPNSAPLLSSLPSQHQQPPMFLAPPYQPLQQILRIPIVGLMPLRPRVDVKKQQRLRQRCHPPRLRLCTTPRCSLVAAAAQLMRWHTDQQLLWNQLLKEQQQQQVSDDSPHHHITQHKPIVVGGNVRSHNSSPMSYTGSLGGDSNQLFNSNNLSNSNAYQNNFYNSSNNGGAAVPWGGGANSTNPVFRALQVFSGYVLSEVGSSSGANGGGDYYSYQQQTSTTTTAQPAMMIAAASGGAGSLVMTTSAPKNIDLWNALKHERHIQEFVRTYSC
ncbi:Hypothetical protein, putative [Bodo saltans]|uniref:Uncharacterized protein n=1 Tax=Bodo saltans TaxID=75058 RepID=A0A0S4JGZ8_BODSA|nr:Hypothetical protein, putative [Bodo saltans]|eukprot:CUG89421.1 Hypothetical protein, putative [Bodo saltans]